MWGSIIFRCCIIASWISCAFKRDQKLCNIFNETKYKSKSYSQTRSWLLAFQPHTSVVEKAGVMRHLYSMCSLVCQMMVSRWQVSYSHTSPHARSHQNPRWCLVVAPGECPTEAALILVHSCWNPRQMDKRTIVVRWAGLHCVLRLSRWILHTTNTGSWWKISAINICLNCFQTKVTVPIIAWILLHKCLSVQLENWLSII